MKEYWTDKMRRKLAGHRKAPPAGLWEDICEQMGIDPEHAPVPARKPTAIRRWSWAAAAAVLALAGFFVFHDNGNEKQALQAEALDVEAISPQQEEQQPKEDFSSEEVPAVALNPSTNTGLAMTQTKPKRQSAITQEEALVVQPSSKDKTAVESASNDKTLAESASSEKTPIESTSEDKTIVEQTPSVVEQQQEQDMRAQLAETTGDKTVQKNESGQEPERQPKRHGSEILLPMNDNILVAQPSSASDSHNWSIGLNASGGLLASQTTSLRSERVYHDCSSLNEETGIFNGATTYTVSDFVSKHHLPIRFGVSVDYRLSPRLTLLSGISYTYLYSQFSLTLYPDATIEQKLHYLGIPLGLAWKWWSSQHFQLYVSGGVTLEKCLNDKPWQWSSHAAAGAEYTFSRLFGFYVEPSLGYYFDDGTDLEHYYKKHPLAPSIEFGLRMHLNQ